MVTSHSRAKTQEVELFVERLIPGGDGIANWNGKKVFVRFAAPNERIKAQIILEKKDYAVARIEKIIVPSPLRVKPRCQFYGQCGGCQLQHIIYTGQLVIKKLLINDALQHIGRIYVPVDNIKCHSIEWCYRNKTQYPVRRKNQVVKIGYFQRNSHRLIEITNCLLHPEYFDELRTKISQLIFETGEMPYDEITNSGNIRHIVLRQNEANGALIIVVTRTRKLKEKFAEKLMALPRITGVVQSINPLKTDRILGTKTVLLSGNSYVEYEILGNRFRVSATSFFQVNIGQAEELCRQVVELLAPDGAEKVIDLFSGVGMLSLVVAPMVRKVVGIEIEPSAVADAQFNAKVQNRNNVEFIQGDVNKSISRIDSADAVIVDPPRKGCTPELLNQIANLNSRSIIYVSCNPVTLARDLAILERYGYLCDRIKPLDMFPQTAHVEVVVRLIKG